MGRELTIGNWYKADISIKGSIEAKLGFGDGRMFKMTKEHLVIILRFDLEFKIKPIPLTEDILLKCEGVKHDFNDWYIIEFKDYEMCVNIIDKSLTIGDDYSERLISSNLEYVHQFQNIIFALTNEELEINL